MRTHAIRLTSRQLFILEAALSAYRLQREERGEYLYHNLMHQMERAFGTDVCRNDDENHVHQIQELDSE